MGGWGKCFYCYVIFLFRPAVPPKSFGGEAQAGGQKGRGLGGRNFCPPASVPVPFEQEKSGRGVWGNSAFLLLNQNEASPATCLNTWKAGNHRKILFSLEEKEIGRAQNEKSKEYFSVVWRACRAVAGLASLLGVLLKKCSNINQKTPPKLEIGIGSRNGVGTKCRPHFGLPHPH